jgi:hypothetical protein
MSPRTLIKNLFYSPLPALLAYSSIMFAGNILAGAEKKTSTITDSAVVSHQTHEHQTIAKSARFRDVTVKEKK